jgi:hypothetical protein
MSGKDFEPFEGFDSPNGTVVPDVVFDRLMPQLGDAELRVLLYVIRRTFGFKKDADSISVQQMVHGITTRDGRVLDQGTGLVASAVHRGVNGLEARGIIIAERREDPRRGSLPTVYRLRFREVGGVSSKRTPPSPAEGHPRVLLEDPQQTVLQQTVLQQTELDVPVVSKTGGVARGGKNIRRASEKEEEPSYLDVVIHEFSEFEFQDLEHLASNQQQARNLLLASGLDEKEFVESYVYPARNAAKWGARVENRAAYFYTLLRQRVHDTPSVTNGVE